MAVDLNGFGVVNDPRPRILLWRYGSAEVSAEHAHDGDGCFVRRGRSMDVLRIRNGIWH